MRVLKNTKVLEEAFKYEPIVRPIQRIKPNGAFIGKEETAYSCDEIPGNVTFDLLIKSLKEGKEYEIVGFMYGLVIYAGKRFFNDVKWDYSITEDDPLKTILKCLSEKKIPAYLKDELYYFCNKPPLSFEKYLELCRKERVFNLESAKNVYKLQGDESIPIILQQIFTPPTAEEYVILPDKNVKIEPPKIDSDISGTFFPCLVTKRPKNLEVRLLNNTICLIGMVDDKEYVMDIYCSGNFPLYDKSLSMRMGFFGAAGPAPEGYVCYNYIDLVDATSNLEGDCLIRNLREDLVTTSWFNWGPSSTMNVEINKERLKGTTPNTDIIYKGKYEGKHPYIKINMRGETVREVEKKEIIYSSDNIVEFLELFKIQNDLINMKKIINQVKQLLNEFKNEYNYKKTDEIVEMIGYVVDNYRFDEEGMFFLEKCLDFLKDIKEVIDKQETIKFSQVKKMDDEFLAIEDLFKTNFYEDYCLLQDSKKILQ